MMPTDMIRRRRDERKAMLTVAGKNWGRTSQGVRNIVGTY